MLKNLFYRPPMLFFIMACVLILSGCGKDAVSSIPVLGNDNKDIAERTLKAYVEQQLYHKNTEAQILGVALYDTADGLQRNRFNMTYSTHEGLVDSISRRYLTILTIKQRSELAEELANSQMASNYRMTSSKSDNGTIFQIELDIPDIEKLQQDAFELSIKKCQEKFPNIKGKDFSDFSNMMYWLGRQSSEDYFKKIFNNYYSYNEGIIHDISFQKDVSDIIMESYQEILQSPDKIPFRTVSCSVSTTVKGKAVYYTKLSVNGAEKQFDIDNINGLIWSGFNDFIEGEGKGSVSPTASGYVQGEGYLDVKLADVNNGTNELNVHAKKLPVESVLQNRMDRNTFKYFVEDHGKKLNEKLVYYKVDCNADIAMKNTGKEEIEVVLSMVDAYGYVVESEVDRMANNKVTGETIKIPAGKEGIVKLNEPFYVLQLKSKRNEDAAKSGEDFMIRAEIRNKGRYSYYMPIKINLR